MSKSEHIAEFLEKLGSAGKADSHYGAYFYCFNRGDYYEAHDVLEQLWLRESGSNALFFKALIQVAGAFVHMQKQFLHPSHPKHGRRLRPAARLLRLSAANFESFLPRHLQLDLHSLCSLCLRWAAEIETSGFSRNPWHPSSKPQLQLSPEMK